MTISEPTSLKPVFYPIYPIQEQVKPNNILQGNFLSDKQIDYIKNFLRHNIGEQTWRKFGNELKTIKQGDINYIELNNTRPGDCVYQLLQCYRGINFLIDVKDALEKSGHQILWDTISKALPYHYD